MNSNSSIEKDILTMADQVFEDNPEANYLSILVSPEVVKNANVFYLLSIVLKGTKEVRGYIRYEASDEIETGNYRVSVCVCDEVEMDKLKAEFLAYRN
jgi:hypothetical protein